MKQIFITMVLVLLTVQVAFGGTDLYNGKSQFLNEEKRKIIEVAQTDRHPMAPELPAKYTPKPDIEKKAREQTQTETSNYLQAPQGGRTNQEQFLSIGVLIFGFLVILLQVIIMLKVGKGWGVNSTRIVGLTLVIIAGLFLITAGYSENQIAPMIGLLGTIAGYLLGKTEK